MSALVLSSKVWDDNSLWNRDFSEVFPSFSLGRLNQLEVAVLGVLRVSSFLPCGSSRRRSSMIWYGPFTSGDRPSLRCSGSGGA